MIRPADLRIGNFTKQGRVTHLPMGISHSEWQIGCDWSHFKEVEPIEISDSWLLKFGFVKSKDKSDVNTYDELDYTHRDLKGFYYYLNGKAMTACNSWCDAETEIPREIKYVHELQNIFYYMTGKELLVVNPKHN